MNLIERLRKRATDSPSFVLLEQAADEIERLTAERDALLLALGEIAWSNDSRWQSDRAKAAIVAARKA